MSAIAARKARLAATTAAEQESSTSTSSSLPSPSSTPRTRARRQRESVASSSENADTPIKRKRRAVAAPSEEPTTSAFARRKARSRYFAGPTAAAQDGGDAASSADEAEGSRSSSDEEGVEGGEETSGSRSSRYKWAKSVLTTSKSKTSGNVAIVDPNKSTKGKATSDEGSIVVGLRSGESFSFLGIASLQVLKGTIEVNDVALSAGSTSSHLLFCPTTSCHPVITALESHEQEETSAASVELLAKSRLQKDAFSAIVVLAPIRSTGLHKLPLVCPIAGVDPFSSAKRDRYADDEILALSFLRCYFGNAAAEASTYQSPDSWKRAYETLRSKSAGKIPQTHLVRGAKGAGKSTFARTILNILRQPRIAQIDEDGQNSHQVAFLDLDPGQAEFGVPGSLSLYLFSDTDEPETSGVPPLLSPSWMTHSSSPKPVLSHYLGQTTPRDSPSLYLAAVSSLVDHYYTHLHSKGIELVVNTMGWTKGLGAELAMSVEGMLQPDHIYDLLPTVERSGSYLDRSGISMKIPLPKTSMTPPYRDAYGAILSKGSQIVPVQAIGLDLKLDTSLASTASKGLTAADQRVLSIMTALHARPPFAGSSSPPRWDFSQPLLEQRPIELDVTRALSSGIQLLPPLASPVDVGLALATLNGEIVGLVKDVSAADEAHTQPDSSAAVPNQDAWTAALSHPPSALQNLHFHSLALIRSLSPEKAKLYLLCPHPPSATDRNASWALVKSSGESGSGSSGSNVELPIWASLDRKCIELAKNGKLGIPEEALNVGAAAGGDGGVMPLDQSNGLESTAQPVVAEGDDGHPRLAGVRFDQVPYVEWPILSSTTAVEGRRSKSRKIDGVIGRQRRKVRRNLMRRNQG